MNLSSFQHSLFLGALGNAIINSLWQGFLLWIVYETIIISYKNINAKIKHNLSVLFILSSFIWFTNTFISNFLITEKLSSFISQPANLEIPGKGKSSFFNFFLSFTSDILPYLSIAYIMLLIFLMAKLYTSYRHVHFVSHKHLTEPPSHLKTFSEKVVGQLRISKKIKVWISNHIEVPATIGFIKPVILIPFASINNLTIHQLEAIILHELSHIKRNDYLVNLLVSVIETILFFNPFVAIFIKIIKRERENCCDDFVLQYRYDPHSYASALLRLEQSRKNNIQLALGAVSGKKQLLSRIKRITGNNTVTQFNYGQKLLALLITTGIFCSLAWLSPSRLKKEVKNTSSKMSANVTTQESPFAANQKVIIENNVESKENLKIKKDQQKIKNKQQAAGFNVANDKSNVSEEDEKIALFDKNFFSQFTNLPNPLPALILNQPNIESLIPKNILKIQTGEQKKLDEEISRGIKQAYQEIDKINWKEVQNNINKSFSEMNIDQLPEKQKEAIAQARKYLSIINLDKQQFKTSKIFEEIQDQQKLIADSLRAAGTTLVNLRPARLAAKAARIELQALNNSTTNFSFNFNTEPQQKLLKKDNNRNEEKILEVNGREFKINIRQTPSQTESLPRTIKKIKASQRIIADI